MPWKMLKSIFSLSRSSTMSIKKRNADLGFDSSVTIFSYILELGDEQYVYPIKKRKKQVQFHGHSKKNNCPCPNRKEYNVQLMDTHS